MRRWFWLCLLLSVTAAAQQQSKPGSSPATPPGPQSNSSQTSSQTQKEQGQREQDQKESVPDPSPADSQNASPQAPRSGNISADAIPSDGASSSKDTPFDITPPPGDAQAHPQSSDLLLDEGSSSGNGDVREFHPWDPHKAAKNVEVGDFYFKRKNYRAAEDRYREALLYKDNDALATIRLAVCLEKLERPDDARKEYENYLKILPHGPQAEEASKAIARLKPRQTSSAK
jgi:tetratricopeptide (TPR) repeat protein